MQKQIQRIYFDLDVIAFHLVSLNTRFYWEREYLSSGVNMLTNNLKIIDTTKKEFSEIILFQSDQKLWEKHCCGDLASVPNTLTCWLSIIFLTECFCGI